MARRRAANSTKASTENDKVEKEDAKEVEDVEDNPAPKRGRRAAKKVEKEVVDDIEEEEEEVKPAKKRGRKAKEEPAPKKAKLDDEDEDKSKKSKAKPAKTLLNKSSTDYTKINFECDKKSSSGESWNFKISSWNVDGIRAWMNKGGLEYIGHEKPDVLCLQETKCSEDKLPPEIKSVPDYHQYWASSEKEGYAGVGILSKKEAKSVIYGIDNEEFDAEGRIITVEYDQFYLICTYVPNSGRGLVTLSKRLEWNKLFRQHVKDLNAKKPVIICGDMNVSHLEIDLANPKTNKKNAGFTQEERDGMTEFLEDGYIDTFRKLYPDQTGAYTFWTYMMNSRSKNVGWRLDYFIVSEKLMTSVCDNIIRNEVFGSDHCPLTLFLHVKDE